jgi:hypothetical protein
MNSDHPQLGEAVEWLQQELSFAIVDPSNPPGREVRVNANERFECTIESTSKEEPSADLKRNAEARGFTVERVTDRFHFGPKMGQEFTFHRIARGSMDVETAAREAIELFLLVAGQSRSDWLWITNENYADRGKAERPLSWPPAGT